MKGSDLRTIASMVSTSDNVFFLDKDKNVHEVYTCRRVRSKEVGGSCLVFMEIGTMVQEFGDLRVEKPPQELIDYLNEKYGEI